MFERACGACEQAKQVLSVYVGRWEESRSDLEIEVVVEDQDRRGGRWMDGMPWESLRCLRRPRNYGSLVFISVQREGFARCAVRGRGKSMRRVQPS
jgi:hypothetical protein